MSGACVLEAHDLTKVYAMGEIELPDVARLVALDVGTRRRSAVRAARAELDALITSVKPR